MRNKVALIDGDIIVYKVAYEKAKLSETSLEAAGETPFTSEGIPSSEEAIVERTWEEIKNSIDEFMLFIHNETATTHYIGFLSPSRANNFRTAISKTIGYKANRDNREVPRFFSEIKQYLCEEYGFLRLMSIETDDALACIQSVILGNPTASYEEIDSVICSIDKDMLQVEGRHWNWKSNDYKEVTHQEAYRTLWTQILTGDTTDNILGCGCKEEMVYKSGKKKGESYVARVGVGPKEAEAIINECLDLGGDTLVLKELPIRVMTEFINRFGLANGINKFHEAFNLIFLLRTWPSFEDQPWEAAIQFLPWHKEEIKTEEDEDTF